MNLITLDFETYYAQDFSLTKLTTEEYIRDKRFEVIGVGVKVNDEETVWVSGTHDDIAKYLSTLPWNESALLCHNTLFDGAILAWVFGITPSLYLDTLSMARAFHGVDAGGSLAALVERYGLGAKGTEVLDAKGKLRTGFSPSELARYGEYCKNDVELTLKLFRVLVENFPEDELQLIDMTLKMFIQPVLELDDALLVDRLEEVRAEKQALLGTLKEKLNCEAEEDVRKKLASNKQFAELLKEYGVEPPLKTSKTTGKLTFALAKNDEGFIALTEHEDPFIQQLCSVRLGTKSTIEESRIERFINVGARNKGKLPIPLKYYGAHTGRWAGSDKVNFQNLPSRDKKKKALKNAVIAPDGYMVINCDSSQIEARVLAWLAGQEDVVKQFANNEDVYSIFASTVYDRPISKANPVERFVGKTCIAHDSPVLTDKGLIPIQNITLEHKLWDGVEWVTHEGLVYQGEKNVITYQGLTATEDHGVFTEHGPIPFGVAASRLENLTRTGNGREKIRISGDYFQRHTTPEEEHLCVDTMYSVWKQKMDSQRQPSTRAYKRLSTMQPNKIKALSGSWAAIRRYHSSVQSKLESYVQTLWAAWNKMPIQLSYGFYTLGGKELTAQELHRRGDRQNRQRWALRGGKFTSGYTQGTSTQPKKHSESILGWNINAYSRVSVSVQPDMDIQTSSEAETNRRTNFGKVRVYDILNAGPRRRFTVSDVLVFNCVLGLGYGTGAAKLQHTLKTTPPGCIVDDEEAKRIVSLYRETNYKIIELWRDGDMAIRNMANWEPNDKPYFYGEHQCLQITQYGVRLPNGLYIRYPDLRIQEEEGKLQYIYKSRKGPVSLWGGSLVENVVQALARIIVGQQMIRVSARYRPALTVHDAAVCIVKEDEVEDAMRFITGVMSEPPEWAIGLPVACEAGVAKSYGDC